MEVVEDKSGNAKDSNPEGFQENELPDKSKKSVIIIPVTHGCALIWNTKDTILLRKKFRIIGSFIGSLPKNPHQNIMKGLPLMLMPEEATFLKEMEYAKLVNYTDLGNSSEILAEKYKDAREKNFEVQKKLAFEQRKDEIERIVHFIYENKIKKFKNIKTNITVASVLEEEIANIKPLPESKQNIQTCVEHPFIDLLSATPCLWSFPRSEVEKRRYIIFKDLWSKNYTLTSGFKFGGDFLAYEGDPLLYHSKFIIKCVGYYDFASLDVIALARIGTTTKKTLVLAAVDEHGSVTYKSINWLGNENLSESNAMEL